MRVLLLVVAATSLSSCGTEFGGGSIRGQAALGGVTRPNEKVYGLLEAAACRDADLPSQIDLRRDGVVPPIQNQRWNNCVGWALGYFVMSALEMRHYRNHRSVLDSFDSENWFSPDYVYAQRDVTEDEMNTRNPELVGTIKCQEPDGSLGCMRPEIAISALMSSGCCRWPFLCTEMPSAFRSCSDDQPLHGGSRSTLPWQIAEPSAWHFRPRCFVRFGDLDTMNPDGSTVRQMQSWLHREGTPIAIIVRMTEGWVRYAGENVQPAPVLYAGRNCGLIEQRGICLDAVGRELGSQHMMTIIGYDANFPDSSTHPHGSFLIANQWGTKWGQDGYMWIPASELAKIWVGGYGLSKTGAVLADSTPEQGIDPSVEGRDALRACRPDEFGRFVQVGGETDDVPINLLVNDVGFATERSATGLGLAPAISSPEGVGGQDVADWYWFTVGSDSTVSCFLTSSTTDDPLPELTLRLTDEQFCDRGCFDPSSKKVFAELAAGDYFVKVRPDYESTYAPGSRVNYRLHVETSDGPAPCTEADSGRLEVDPVVLGASSVTVPADGSWSYFRIDARSVYSGAWQLARRRIEISDLADGDQLQVVVGGPSGFTPPSISPVQVLDVDHEGLDLTRTPLVRGTANCLYADVFVGIRSATPGASVSFSLRLSILPQVGIPSLGDPQFAGIEVEGSAVAVPLIQAPPLVGTCNPNVDDDRRVWWRHGSADGRGPKADRFRFREFRAPDWTWGLEVIEVKHACPSITIVLVDEDGGPLNEVGLVALAPEAPNASVQRTATPGVLRMRLDVPPMWTDDASGAEGRDVWVELYDDRGAPLRHFQLRRLQYATLQEWPLRGSRVSPPDGETLNSGCAPVTEDTPDRNAPATSQELTVDGPCASGKIGRTSPDQIPGISPDVFRWNLFDYYTVTNTTSSARPLWIRMRKEQGNDNNVDLFRYSLDEARRNEPRSCTKNALPLSSGAHDGNFIPVLEGRDVAPGETVQILVSSEGGGILQVDYSIRVVSSAPPPDPSSENLPCDDE